MLLSRHLPLPVGAGENDPRLLNLLRRDTNLGSKRHEGAFVASDVGENAAKKARLRRGGADGARLYAGQRQKADSSSGAPAMNPSAATANSRAASRRSAATFRVCMESEE